MELGRENSSSRWWARNDGEEGAGADGDAAAVVLKGWSRGSDERARPRDMGMAGVELGGGLGRWIGGGSGVAGRGPGAALI